MQLEADNTDDDKRDACNTGPIAALRLNNRRALARIRSRIGHDPSFLRKDMMAARHHMFLNIFYNRGVVAVPDQTEHGERSWLIHLCTWNSAPPTSARQSLFISRCSTGS